MEGFEGTYSWQIYTILQRDKCNLYYLKHIVSEKKKRKKNLVFTIDLITRLILNANILSDSKTGLKGYQKYLQTALYVIGKMNMLQNNYQYFLCVNLIQKCI